MSVSAPKEANPPKLFISYSWSSLSHEQWVLKLAHELAELGIHVIIDKWDLKEGHDAYAFMERMVTDPDIKKVVMVVDEVYAAKADGRRGGVGAEAQILTPELYGEREQDKFVAVVTEKDADGKPFLPAYYRSRIYIDLSEPDTYPAEFERLVRWAYDKPLYKRPERGKRPAFLDEADDALTLGTSALFRRAIDALKTEKSYASAALGEYLDLFSQNLERFRITEFEGEFDDAVVANLDAFLPYRNELIGLFGVVSQYAPTTENVHKLHDFFETLIPYLNVPENAQRFREWDFDNFRFIAQELYLYAVAVLIKHSRFEQAADFMGQDFYVTDNRHYSQEQMMNAAVFMNPTKSIEHRNARLNTRWFSPTGNLLKERCTGVGIEFRQLMQADFVLYIREQLYNEDAFKRWWPDTLVYAGRSQAAFEIFSRAASRRYFDRMKVLLGIDNPEDLEPLMNAYKTGERRVPKWSVDWVDPAVLLNFEGLAKKP